MFLSLGLIFSHNLVLTKLLIPLQIQWDSLLALLIYYYNIYSWFSLIQSVCALLNVIWDFLLIGPSALLYAGKYLLFSCAVLKGLFHGGLRK